MEHPAMKKLILLTLFLTGCPPMMVDCQKMCGDKGVLMFHRNSETCVCQQQVSICREPVKEPLEKAK
jgi:hypothetical protein